jgi:soluble P-type ATPase
MITIDFPGHKVIRIEHVVMDYNGTVAFDGHLLDGVAHELQLLAELASVHILTADTFGEAQRELEGLPCKVIILGDHNQDLAKMEYVRNLGMGQTAAIGNGRNDRIMLKEAELGIAVIQSEGASLETVLNADVVCHNILDALRLLTHPRRLVATLRT